LQGFPGLPATGEPVWAALGLQNLGRPLHMASVTDVRIARARIRSSAAAASTESRRSSGHSSATRRIEERST
jgi:hypothetical protein